MKQRDVEIAMEEEQALIELVDAQFEELLSEFKEIYERI